MILICEFLSNSGVSMTGVAVGDLACSEDTKLGRFGVSWSVLVTALSSRSVPRQGLTVLPSTDRWKKVSSTLSRLLLATKRSQSEWTATVGRLDDHSTHRTHGDQERFPVMTITSSSIQMGEHWCWRRGAPWCWQTGRWMNSAVRHEVHIIKFRKRQRQSRIVHRIVAQPNTDAETTVVTSCSRNTDTIKTTTTVWSCSRNRCYIQHRYRTTEEQLAARRVSRMLLHWHFATITATLGELTVIYNDDVRDDVRVPNARIVSCVSAGTGDTRLWTGRDRTQQGPGHEGVFQINSV